MKKLIILVTVLLFCLSANSQKRRLALVIGNANYPMSILANPVNDAIEMEALLKASGFQVKRYTDLDQTDMKRVIDEFGSSLNSAEVGLFFYAGHGIQANGRNYLIPVDASLKTENDVEYNCVDAGRILAKMEDAGTKTNIVILDACRDNPFERSWSRKSTGQGLAFMDAPMGSLIAYSTAPGKTASDGSGKNSPYTSALIQYMKIPNIKIEDFFKKVRVQVRKQTNDRQTPWESTSLEGDFYFQLDPDWEPQEIPVAAVEPTINYPDNIDQTEQRVLNFEENKKRLAAEIRSVAILPFAIYTGDESQVYLVSGMHDALITELGQIGAIRVVGKTSTLQYANFQKTIKEIASELNVDGIIEASVLIINENIRIQLRLFSAFPEEQQLWSQTFNSDMSNILNLYNLVIKDIANEIQLTLSPEQQTQLAETKQVNPEAYEAYLKGKFYLQNINQNNLDISQKHFELAIEKDPGYAQAYIGIAYIWLIRQQAGFTIPEEAGPKVMEAILKAAELDSTIAEVHFLLASINYLRVWDWKTSESEFQKALAINPNYADAHGLYAQLLYILGRPKEAIKHSELSFKLDPLNQIVKMWYGFNLLYEKRYDEIISIYREVLEMDSTNFLFYSGINEAFHLKGKHEEALEATKLYYINLYPDIDHVFDQYPKVGYTDVMNLEGDLLVKQSEKKYIIPADIVSLYVMAGNKEKALEWLEKGYELRDPLTPYIGRPFFSGLLLNEPRYQNLLRKLNIPSYD